MQSKKKNVWPMFMLLLQANASVKAFTISSYKSNIKAYPAPRRLLYTNNPNSLLGGVQSDVNRSEESIHVARIRQCTSPDEVQMAVKGAASNLSLSDGGPSKRIPSLPKFLFPNVAAAALLRMAQLNSRQVVKDESAVLIWSLVQRLSDLMNPPQASTFTIYALVDIISALPILKRKLEFGELPDTDFGGELRMQRLATVLAERIDHHREELLRTQNPSRMVDVLYAFHILGFGNKVNKQHRQATAKIQADLCQSLTKSHALSALSAGDMSIILVTLAAAPQPFRNDQSALAIALMRRFRKQAVRKGASTTQLLKALRAVTEIGVRAKELAATGDDGLFKEAQLMVFTVFKGILQEHSTNDNQQTEAKNTNDCSMSLQQTSDMLRCVSSMEVLKQPEGSSVSALRSLWGCFLSTTSHKAFSHASVGEMAQFLRAVEAAHSEDLALTSQHVRQLGERLQVEVLVCLASYADHQEARSTLNPQSVNTILRYVALEWGNNETALQPFLGCAKLLFSDDSFLAGCTAAELTNFLIFMEKTRHHQTAERSTKEDPLIGIAERMLNPEVADSVSPSQASRILTSFTIVVDETSHAFGTGPSKALMNATRNMFHALGGHLLTDSPDELSPRDISDALRAYARASYIQDMGIFDQLVYHMSDRLADCNIRQVTQSLWACGKMTIWEAKHRQDSGDDSLLPPPYIPAANELADFLLQRQDDMTAKDVAQALWALARLQSVQSVDDDAVSVDDFLTRAIILAPQMTSREVANILWGMGTTGFKECGPLVQAFTDRILQLHKTPAETSTPQDSAMVMMALGRMNIQDKKVFQVLSDGMLDQLDVASAQAIANALWAHKAVHITPPRQLLDRWAIERLGLVAVQPRRQS